MLKSGCNECSDQENDGKDFTLGRSSNETEPDSKVIQYIAEDFKDNSLTKS